MQTNFNPVVSTSIYVSGYNVGGLLALPGLTAKKGDSIAITDVLLIDKSSNAMSYELHFFDTLPVGTITDHAAYAVNATDLLKSQGFLSLSGMALLNGGGVIQLSNIYKRIAVPNLAAWAVLLTRGTPTFAAATDLTLKITTEFLGPV